MQKVPLFVFFLIIGTVFVLTILAPKTTKAELVTGRDWIGLFDASGSGDAKTDTIGGNNWKYANSCSQTPGANPLPANTTSPCNFTMPTASGAYELRMYPNDSSLEMMDQSKVIWTNFNVNIAGSGGCGSNPYVKLSWPPLNNVSSIDIYRDSVSLYTGLPGTTTTFTDTTVSAGDHSYQVQANSNRSADPNGKYVTQPANISLCTAAAASCPGGTNPVRLDSGFLTTVDSNAQNNFSQTGTSIFCITGERAAIPQFSIPTYEDMESLYFTQAIMSNQKTTINKGGSPATMADLNGAVNGTNGWIIRVQGDVTINTTGLFLGETGPIVVFVQGDLNINQNITYGDTSSRSGLVFVVKGQVNVAPKVTQVNAIIITTGQFCSAYSPYTNHCDSFTSNNQLTINGSVISLATDSAQQPLFVRNLQIGTNINTQPAEKIIYQPKYMVIFKDIFSRDLVIWNEMQ
ncbi:MAG: hypothetical protein M1142_01070 [Patescibacteria group bacterium]|nr:hypothetical protein [Patescibacteria group bacterium]